MNVQLILDFRYKNKMRQADLAELLGVGRTTVAKWEEFANTPRLGTLKKLAKIMGVGVEELIADED